MKNKILKNLRTIAGIFFFAFLLFGIFSLVLNSKSVRESEYKSCMITSTDKSICQSLKE